nr:hypothetical protein [Mesorhizobium sp.]
MSTARPYEEQDDPGGRPATTTAPVSSTLVTPHFGDLAGKAVLVTATGIGGGTCTGLRRAEMPRRAAFTIQVAENLAKTIRKGGGELFPVQGDFSIAADVERVVTRSISAARWPGQQCRLGRVP